MPADYNFPGPEDALPEGFSYGGDAKPKTPEWASEFGTRIDDPSQPNPVPTPEWAHEFGTLAPRELSFGEGLTNSYAQAGLGLQRSAYGLKGMIHAGGIKTEAEIKALVADFPNSDFKKQMGDQWTAQDYEALLRRSSASAKKSRDEAMMRAKLYGQTAADPSIASSESANSLQGAGDWRFYTENIAKSAPQLAASMLAGMATGGASVPVRIAAFAAPNTAPEVGGYYADAVERGQSHEIAAGGAAIVGVANGLLEAIPGAELFLKNPASRQVFSKFVQNKAGDFLVHLGGVATAEAFTEAAQEFVPDFTKYMLENDPKAFAEWRSRYPMAGLIGGVMGGGMGGVNRVSQHASGMDPLGQPGPETGVDLWQKAPEVAQALSDTLEAKGSISRSQWKTAAAAAQGAGVSLPYIRYAEPATAWTRAMAANKPTTEPQATVDQPPAARETPPASAPSQAPVAPPAGELPAEGHLWQDSDAYYRHLLDRGVTPEDALGQIAKEGMQPPKAVPPAAEPTPPAAEQVSPKSPTPPEPKTPATPPKTPATPPAFTQTIGSDEPPIPEGMIRLYHGGVPYEGGKRWLTADRKYAEGYDKKVNSEVQYVDVPRDNQELVDAGVSYETYRPDGTPIPGPPNHFEGSESLVSGLKPLATAQPKAVTETPSPTSKVSKKKAPLTKPKPIAEKPAAFKMPNHLAGAKPTYGYRDRQFDLSFDSDLDKALYILAQKKPSKADAQYLDSVLSQTRMSEEAAREKGQRIRDVIKGLAKDAKAGVKTLTIPKSETAKYYSPEDQPVSPPIATLEPPVNTVASQSDVQTEVPTTGAPTNGQEETNAETQGQTQGRQEGLLATTAKPVAESKPAPATPTSQFPSEPASTKIDDATLRNHLQSVENKSSKKPYAPLSDSETANLIAGGYAQKKRGKITLTNDGRSKLNDLNIDERRRQDAEDEAIMAADRKAASEPASQSEESLADRAKRLAKSKAIVMTEINGENSRAQVRSASGDMVTIQPLDDFDAMESQTIHVSFVSEIPADTATVPSQKPAEQPAPIDLAKAVEADPRLKPQLETKGEQAANPGLEDEVQLLNAKNAVWSPVERALSEHFDPDFVAQHRSIVLNDIPKVARNVIRHARENVFVDEVMSEEDMRSAVRDITYDTSYDEWPNPLPSIEDSSYIRDPITGRIPPRHVRSMADDAQAELMQEALLSAAYAEFDKQLPEILQDQKKARDKYERENSVDTVGDIFYHIPSELDNPTTPEAKAARDAWFNKQAVKMGYDPANLQDALSNWTKANDPVVDSKAPVEAQPTKPEPSLTEPEVVDQPPPANPTFRDWKWKQKTPNSGHIVPGIKATYLTDTQIGELLSWIRSHGWTVAMASPSGIEVIDPNGPLNLSMRGWEGAVQEHENAVAAQEWANKKIDVAGNRERMWDEVASRKSGPFIMSLFTRDALGHPMDALDLAMFLEGEKRKFDGKVTEAWRDGLEAADALFTGGDQGVDWPTLRRAYEDSLNKPVVEAIPPTEKIVKAPVKIELQKHIRRTPTGKTGEERVSMYKSSTSKAREQLEVFMTNLGKVNNELRSLPKNASKKRKPHLDSIKYIQGEIEKLDHKIRDNDRQLELQQLEDAIDAATDPAKQLRLFVDLYRVQHSIAMSSSSTVHETHAINQKSDEAWQKLTDIAESMVQDDGLVQSERDWVAGEAVRNWAPNSDYYLQDGVARAIVKMREARVGGMVPKIDGYKSISPERRQDYADEIAATMSAGTDWKAKQNEILERLQKENETARIEALKIKAEADKEYARQAEIAADEKIKSNRLAAVSSQVEKRYWPEARKRANKIKGKQGEFFPALDSIDAKTQGRTKSEIAVKGEIIGKYAIVTEKGDDGKNLYKLYHVATGLSAGYVTNISAVRSVFALANDVGADLQSIRDNGTFEDNSRLMASVFVAGLDQSLSMLDEDAQRKSLATVTIAPHNVKADIVLNSFELGKHGGNGLLTSGLRLIEGGSIQPRDAQGDAVGGTVQSDGMAYANPAFRANPVFEVNERGNLVFESGMSKFEVSPTIFNLGRSELAGVKTVGINLNDIGIKPLTAAEAVAESLKFVGFQNVKVKGSKITGSFGDSKVIITGDNNQWIADGSNSASKIANQTIKQMGWLKGDSKPKEIGGPQVDSQPAATKIESPVDESEADDVSHGSASTVDGPSDPAPERKVDVLNASVRPPKVSLQEARAAAADYSEAWFVKARPEAESKPGKQLLAMLHKDAKRSPGQMKVGYRTIGEWLAQRMHAMTIYGNSQTSKKHPANFRRRSVSSLGIWATNVIRSRTRYGQINYHEVGHAMSYVLENRKPGWRRGIASKLEQLTYLHSPSVGASAHNAEEGMAEFVRRTVENPQSLPKSIAAEVTKVLDSIDPKLMQVLRDAHRAYVFQRKRPMTQQRETMQNDKGMPKGFIKTASGVFGGIFYGGIGTSTVINRLQKKVHYAISSEGKAFDTLMNTLDFIGIMGSIRSLVDPAYRDRLAVANQAREDAKNSNYDIDTAARSLDVQINEEVAQVLGGVSQGIEGVRAYNDVLERIGQVDENTTESSVSVVNGKEVSVGDLLPSELEALAAAGLPVPEPVGQGEYLYLTDKSFEKIRSEVGQKDWAEFQQFGYMVTDLAGWEAKRQEYPGITEGFTPDALKAEIASLNEKHPTWMGHYKDIENLYGGLLMLQAISGERSVADIVKMRTAYPNYWANEKQQDDQNFIANSGINSVPSSGVGRRRGSQRLNIPLESMMYARARRSLEAFYMNRFRSTLGRYIATQSSNPSIPFKSRVEIGQIMLPLKTEMKVAATLSDIEQQTLVADSMNRTMILDAGMGQQFREDVGKPLNKASTKELYEFTQANDLQGYEPEDIAVSRPNERIWREARPNALNVVATYNHGDLEFWQITDPLLYQVAMGGKGAADYAKGFELMLKPFYDSSKSFSRNITQRPAFAAANVSTRDPVTAWLISDSWVPLYEASYGAAALIHEGGIRSINLYRQSIGLPAIESPSFNAVAQGQLMMNQMTGVSNTAHKRVYSGFLDMLGEGIYIPGYRDMDFWTKVASIPGVAFSLVRKWGDITNYVLGGRLLSTYGELMPRLGAELSSLASGATPERAQMMRGRITGEFGQKPGNRHLAKLARMLTFVNAGIQIIHGSTQKFYDPNPHVRLKQAIKAGPLLVAFGSMLAAANYLFMNWWYDDEEEREEARKQVSNRPEKDRLLSWSPGGIFRFPFGTGAGAGFFAFGYNSTDQWLNDAPIDKYALAKHTLKSAFDLPGMQDMVPHDLKAFGEALFGYSLYQDKPIEPDYLRKAYPNNPEERMFPNTPVVYQSMADNSLAKWFDMSPLKIQYYVRNGLSRQLDQLFTYIDRKLKDEPIESSESPWYGELVTRESRGFNSQPVKSVDELDTEYDRVKTSLKARAARDPNDPTLIELATKVDELAPAHASMLAIDKMYQQVKQLRAAHQWDQAKQVEREMTKYAESVLGVVKPKAGITKK